MNFLTKIEQKHLEYLAKLLKYGSSQLKMKSGDNLHFTHLQSFLLFNQVAVHNYSEAICLLCKDARPHAAHVLLRSLFEAYTNAEYIKSKDSEKRLALFAREGMIERNKIANGFEQFIKKYPKKKNSLPVLEEKSIDKMKKFSEGHIKGINNANKLNQKEVYPDIVSRSIKIDEEIPDSEEKGNSELYYHLVFRLLSPYAHLNAFGLEMFTEKGLDIIGQAKDVHHIILQTYLYYFSLLKNLFQHKILDGEMPDRYQKYFKELKDTKIE
ncbi:MAG: hypothetical protein A2V60_01430 [Candidatus Portnoybacteria bacterium RIFCSPHIGHO2_01_FULL_39_19]|nr:MAG: hypothetical protein A2V60_01430 [Candidatus Portnoybacteria bacterium RIFCSPHIGHO2_01_FULL_39_19]